MREPNRRPAHQLGTGIGRHNQDNVAKICLTAIIVGQCTVIHDLQQQVKHIWMSFLHLV